MNEYTFVNIHRSTSPPEPTITVTGAITGHQNDAACVVLPGCKDCPLNRIRADIVDGRQHAEIDQQGGVYCSTLKPTPDGQLGRFRAILKRASAHTKGPEATLRGISDQLVGRPCNKTHTWQPKEPSSA